MAVAPKTFLSESMLHIALWQNIAIVDVAGDMDVHRMRVVRRAYEVLLSEYPAGISSLVLLRPGTPVASQEARDESARFITDLGERLLLVAVVIEDQGVMAQVLRTVIRGLNVVTRNSSIVMLGSIAEAARALAVHAVPTEASVDTTAEFLAAVHQARGTLRTPVRHAAAARA